MSLDDLERLMTHLRDDPALMRELRGLSEEREEWVRWARERGYRITPEEAERLAESRQELCDDDLDMVAGGWDGGTSDDGS